MLSKVYFFGAACASFAHTGTWSISLAAYFFPSLFVKQWVRYLHPSSVFLPPMPWSDIKADSIGTGAHCFLQWDEILTSAMYLLWACSLTVKARQKIGKSNGTVSDVAGLLSASFFVGPAGAALCALWDRDEMILSGFRKSQPQTMIIDNASKLK